jgi:hypothetical protein
MPETHSRAGKRVEQFVIDDGPHERYQAHNPWTGEKLDNGIPILKTVKGGQIVRKDVEYQIIECPECNQDARYTHDSEPVCSNCGIICVGKDAIKRERIVRDAKAAGRFDGEEGDIQ